MTRGRSIFIAIALFGVLFAWYLGSRQSMETSVSFLAVGQGDCTVVTSDGQTILIDAAPASPYSDAGRSIVVPWLKNHGITSISAILLSHPDSDHVGGTPSILAAFPGAQVVISDQFKDDPAMLGHLKTWGMPVNSVDWLPEKSTFRFGHLQALVECPGRPAGSDTNDGSMFVRIWDGAGSVTFSGDAPRNVERLEETRANWNSEILHVGHHGSRTASDPSWLQAVHPRYAVISVGAGNRYGLPTHEVLDELAQDRIQTLRIDQDGTITFVFDGKDFERLKD